MIALTVRGAWTLARLLMGLIMWLDTCNTYPLHQTSWCRGFFLPAVLLSLFVTIPIPES